MMKTNTHEETLPESAKRKHRSKSRPHAAAWLHGSVSKAAAAEHTPYAHTYVAPHAQRRLLNGEDFPRGCFFLGMATTPATSVGDVPLIHSRGGRPATAKWPGSPTPGASLDNTLSPWRLVSRLISFPVNSPAPRGMTASMDLAFPSGPVRTHGRRGHHRAYRPVGDLLWGEVMRN